MKKFLFALAIFAGAVGANAQNTTANAQAGATAAEAPQPSNGDYYRGLTRPMTYDKMIAPYALEVTFAKTVHLIFPAEIRYVDLGSEDLLAAKVDGADNVLRVKAATRGFTNESNISVITDDGIYYSFNVKYADEPVKLSINMAYEIPSGAHFAPVYLPELGNSSPLLVEQIMQGIQKADRREIISSKKMGMEFSLHGIYSHGGLIYLHTFLHNKSAIPFDIETLTFKLIDKRVTRRTAHQEQVLRPVRTLNEVTQVDGFGTESTVFVLPKFTIPEGKRLVVELIEKGGGRHQTIHIEGRELLRAHGIENLKN